MKLTLRVVQVLVQEIIGAYACLIRAAFLPQTLTVGAAGGATGGGGGMSRKAREEWGMWKERRQDAPLAWLPICVRQVR